MADTLQLSAAGATGMLDKSQFNFTVLTPSNSSKNPLPLQIKIGGYCFGQNLNIILSQVTGNSSLVKSQVWQGGKTLNQPATANTVVSWIYFYQALLS